jgi:hypothetical protein
MPLSDVDIQRFAHLFIQLHGDRATAKAREMVAQRLSARGRGERPNLRGKHSA